LHPDLDRHPKNSARHIGTSGAILVSGALIAPEI